MTISVTPQEATAQFPELFQQVLHGEEVVIADNGTELARVVPSVVQTSSKQPRIPGIDKGRLIVPTDFNDPLPEEILRAFEGG